jgi:hypothetical protein
LRSFRCHEGKRIEFHPVTLITGGNGSGKTSVLMALEWALTGRCALTNERGLGGNLERDGANEASVTIALDDGSTITRSTKEGLILDSIRAKSTEAQFAMESRFGFRGDAARLALRASRFFGLDQKAQKSLLSEMLQIDIQHADIDRELSEQEHHLPLRKVLRSIAGDNWANVERVYKVCYEERTAVRRIVKELTAAVAEFQESQVFIAPGELTDLNYKAQVNQNAINAWLFKRGELLGQASAALASQANIAAARVALSEAKCMPGHGSDIDSLVKHIERLESEAGEMARIVHQIDAAATVKAEIAEEIRALEEQWQGAVLCQWADAPCAGAEARRASLSQQIEGKKAALQSVKQDEEALRHKLKSTRSTTEVYEQLREAKTLLEDAWKAKAALDKAQFQLELAEKARVAEPSGDLTTIEAEIAERCKAMEQIQARLDIVKAEMAMRDHQNNMRKRLADASAQAEALNELVAFFAPDGYPARHLRSQISPIVDPANEILQHFNKQLRFTHDLQIEVQSGEGPWVEYRQLCDSEQIVVGLAVQAAFALLSQVGIVVVDRIESLDDYAQNVLFQTAQYLSNTFAGLDHIILIGVRAATGLHTVTLLHHVQLEAA